MKWFWTKMVLGRRRLASEIFQLPELDLETH